MASSAVDWIKKGYIMYGIPYSSESERSNCSHRAKLVTYAISPSR